MPEDSDTSKGGSKNGKKEGLSGSSFFTWFMVIALLGVWTSVAVVWFDLVDYEQVLGKLGIYDADGDGDFDIEDAKVLLGEEPGGVVKNKSKEEDAVQDHPKEREKPVLSKKEARTTERKKTRERKEKVEEKHKRLPRARGPKEASDSRKERRREKQTQGRDRHSKEKETVKREAGKKEPEANKARKNPNKSPANLLEMLRRKLTRKGEA